MDKLCREFFKAFALAACMLAVPCASFAIPAKPTVIEYRQPDGSVIPLYIRGDERAHFFVSTDGYPILRGEDGLFYYAVEKNGKAVVSDMRASRVEERNEMERNWLSALNVENVWQGMKMRDMQLKKQRSETPPMRATSFPTIGVHKSLVILVEYSDVSFSLDNPQDYFYRMLNEAGFSDNGGTGSARDFYVQNSDSLYLPDFDVFGPVTLSHPMSYYGANDWYGNDMRPEQMVVEACQALDDEIDFSEYDSDGDGKVDNVYIFYAGYGEASGGSDDSVWPHSWDLSSAGASLTLDGKRIEHYACSNEVEGNGSYDGIGTFCHEYGHVLGLPDLYATSYTWAFTPGAYSLMDYGSYNNNSRTPPALSAYERYELNWLEPIAIEPTDTIVQLPHIMDSNMAYIIRVGRSSNEYFLLENRQQTGWDEYIPGHGMLVWHVDYNTSVWNMNTVNNDSDHQYVDIEEADDIQSESTQDGDPFPGVSNVTMIDDDTSPSLKSWNGNRTERRISGITETDGLITFRFENTGVEYVAPVAGEPTDVTPVSAILHWTKVDMATGYILNVHRMEGETPVTILLNRNVGDVDSYELTDLFPATTYYYTLRSVFSAGNSPVSVEYSFTTAEPTFEYLSPVAHDAADLTSNSFTASWDAMEGAVSYELNVYTKQLGDVESVSYDFTDKITGLPAGWSTSSRSCYGVTGYYGESFPSLRLNEDGQYLRTAKRENPVTRFAFWYRGISAEASDVTLRIVGYNPERDTWTLITTLSVSDNADVYEITDFSRDYYAMGIEVGCYNGGSVVVDDVEIEYAEVTRVPVDGYDGLQLAECSKVVEGLVANNKYYYRVRAYDGGMFSMYSNEVPVLLSSGVCGLPEVLGVSVRQHAGVVYVTNDTSAPVKAALYTVQGMCVGSYTVDMGTTRIELPARGVYVLHVGGTGYKVVK